jgi:WhiB family redox-sensing transcriptional regulator
MDKLWRLNPDKGCNFAPAEMFFPNASGSKREEQIADAKGVCFGCPVMAECLDFALEHGEEGIWGGTTKEERDELRKVAV